MKTATMSIITSQKPNCLTKQYSLQDGKLVKKTFGAMAEGWCEVVGVKNVNDLAEILLGLNNNQALCFGIPEGKKIGDRVKIVVDSKKKEGEYSRTDKDFCWPEGGGVIFLDHDSGMTKDDFISSVVSVMPELQTVDKIWLPSSSSHIFNGNKDLTGLRGQRLYFLVDDASRIKDIGTTLYKRLWLAGHGHIQISAAGSLLERSSIDATVWQTNRLDFASGADCVSPLRQENRTPEIIIGCRKYLQASSVGAITGQQEFILRKIVSDAKAPLRKESEKTQSAHIEKRLKDLPPEKQKRLKKVYQSAYQTGKLSGDFEIVLFKDGQKEAKTVAEIIANKELYHLCKTLDPIEPEYNNFHKTGILYLDCANPILNSKAHGEMNYLLKEEIQKCDATDRINKMVKQVEMQKNGEFFTVPFPWPRLSLSSCALAPGTVTIIAGPAKAGKSFFTQNIIEHVHELNIGWAYLPLEDDSTAWMWRMLAILECDFVMKHNNKDTASLREEALNRRKQELLEYMENLTENPRTQTEIVNGRKTRKGVSPEFVLDWVTMQAQEKRIIVVDPLVQIDFKGRNRWEAEEAFMRELCGIVGDTGTSLILVCHTTKGRGANASIELTVEDLQGSAAYGRLSHTVLMVDCLEDQEVEIALRGGNIEKKVANRLVSIATARNGSGSRQKLAFYFDENEPKFKELGFIRKKGKKQ